MAGKQRYTPKQVAAALQKTHGMHFLAAKALGCSHDTILNYVKRYALVREASEAQRGRWSMRDIYKADSRESHTDLTDTQGMALRKAEK